LVYLNRIHSLISALIAGLFYSLAKGFVNPFNPVLQYVLKPDMEGKPQSPLFSFFDNVGNADPGPIFAGFYSDTAPFINIEVSGPPF
jgi:hypothetical protein